MKIALTTRERAGISAVMHRGQWGGSPEVLLAQKHLYDGLALGEFKGKSAEQLARLPHLDQALFDLTDDAREVLSAVLSAGGQGIELALLNAGVLERLDPIAVVAAKVEKAVKEGKATARAALSPVPPLNGHKRTRAAKGA
jgi:hypothetical protein